MTPRILSLEAFVRDRLPGLEPGRLAAATALLGPRRAEIEADLARYERRDSWDEYVKAVWWLYVLAEPEVAAAMKGITG